MHLFICVLLHDDYSFQTVDFLSLLNQFTRLFLNVLVKLGYDAIWEIMLILESVNKLENLQQFFRIDFGMFHLFEFQIVVFLDVALQLHQFLVDILKVDHLFIHLNNLVSVLLILFSCFFLLLIQFILQFLFFRIHSF